MRCLSGEKDTVRLGRLSRTYHRNWAVLTLNKFTRYCPLDAFIAQGKCGDHGLSFPCAIKVISVDCG